MIRADIAIDDMNLYDTMAKWGLIFVEADERTGAPEKECARSEYAEEPGEHVDVRTAPAAFDYTARFLIEAKGDIENVQKRLRAFNEAMRESLAGGLVRKRTLRMVLPSHHCLITGHAEPIAEAKEYYHSPNHGIMDFAIVELKTRVSDPGQCKWGIPQRYNRLYNSGCWTGDEGWHPMVGQGWYPSGWTGLNAGSQCVVEEWGGLTLRSNNPDARGGIRSKVSIHVPRGGRVTFYATVRLTDYSGTDDPSQYRCGVFANLYSPDFQTQILTPIAKSNGDYTLVREWVNETEYEEFGLALVLDVFDGEVTVRHMGVYAGGGGLPELWTPHPFNPDAPEGYGSYGFDDEGGTEEASAEDE